MSKHVNSGKKYERHADWHNDFERRVAERKAREAKRRKRTNRIVFATAVVLLAVVGSLYFKIVGEGGDSGSGPVAPGPVASASPTPAPLGGLPIEDWDAPARSILLGYLNGGADQAAFIVRDIQRVTGCAIAYGRLGMSDGVEKKVRADIALQRRTFEHVGVARQQTDDGTAVLVIGVECP